MNEISTESDIKYESNEVSGTSFTIDNVQVHHGRRVEKQPTETIENTNCLHPCSQLDNV